MVVQVEVGTEKIPEDRVSLLYPARNWLKVNDCFILVLFGVCKLSWPFLGWDVYMWSANQKCIKRLHNL